MKGTVLRALPAGVGEHTGGGKSAGQRQDAGQRPAQGLGAGVVRPPVHRPLLTALANEHPLLTLEISFSDRRIDLVDEGVDLAVRIGELADSGSLVARRLGNTACSCVLRPTTCGAAVSRSRWTR